jgi:AraC-like DNA-binding protein
VRPLDILRDPDGQWEMVTAPPAARVRPHVRRYVGWSDPRTIPVRRRELPTLEVPVIISFGAPTRVFRAGAADSWTDLGSFAAGAHDSFVLVETAASAGIQIDFTLLGIHLFLGRPLSDLRNRCVSLADLFGASSVDSLTAELQEAADWDTRFDIVDREIARRLDAACAPANEVLWTWRRIIQSGGRLPVGALVEETGWSQKHLISRFTEHIGLTPKVTSRVVRFGRALDALKASTPRQRFADVAIDAGYYDQAHFDRDVRAFAGVTPTELLRSLQIDGGFVVEV